MTMTKNDSFEALRPMTQAVSNWSLSDFACFFGFFLIVVGNATIVVDYFGYGIEYVGLILLIALSIVSIGRKPILVKDCVFFLAVFSLMSAGPFALDLLFETRASITIMTIVLIVLSSFSGVIICSTERLLLTIKGIVVGCVAVALIGFTTGTFGLNWNPEQAIIGIMFNAGFPVKNYAGGLWLSLFLLCYSFGICSRGFVNKKERNYLFVLFLLTLASGSKGAVALIVMFIVIMNYKHFFTISKYYEPVVSILFGTIVLVGTIYLYNNVLGHVETYGYRINGLNSIISLLSLDSERAFCGLSDIAYANTGYSYTVNLRNYFGWDASVEMAYVNIIAKFGLLGFVAFGLIFFKLFLKTSNANSKKKTLARAILIVLLASGFIETYFSTVHYVVGPLLFCLINGLVSNSSTSLCPNVNEYAVEKKSRITMLQTSSGSRRASRGSCNSSRP